MNSTLPVPRAARIGATAFGAAIAIFGAFSLHTASQIPVSRLAGPVGPHTFPYLISGALLLCGLLLTAKGVLGHVHDPEDDEGPAVGRPGELLLFTLGLVLNVVLIQPVGYVLASTAMFLCVSLAFGSRRPFRNVLIGLCFSAAVYLCFRHLLGINIGLGPFGTIGDSITEMFQ